MLSHQGAAQVNTLLLTFALASPASLRRLLTQPQPSFAHGVTPLAPPS